MIGKVKQKKSKQSRADRRKAKQDKWELVMLKFNAHLHVVSCKHNLRILPC